MSHINTPPNTTRRRRATIDRRNFLRGLGVGISLPAFQSIAPLTTQAAPTAVSETGVPLRTAFVYFPNGAIQNTWWPEAEGTDFKLSPTMQPLANVKKYVQVLGGLDHINATAGPDGAGDHARANATFLTGMRARKTDGSNIEVGTSVDQVIAQNVGHLTRFPSLELSCDGVRKAGRCDSGYSCAYQYNISWSSPNTPMTPEANPRLVFERLFGSGSVGERKENYLRRQQNQKSILDFVMDDAHSLEKQLGSQDQEKLDEYLTGVRAIEKRIEQSERFDYEEPHIETPEGIPSDYGMHMDVMYDMLALAFQTDATRVATLLLAGDGTNRAFPQIGIPEGHHYLSHHQRNQEKIAKIEQIDLYYMQYFAKFLEKLDELKDVDGNSVLHNSMIVYGCGNSDGNRHTHTNLPIVMAGAAGGTMETNRYVKANDVPMSNLFVSMIDRMGVEGVTRFGDSDGHLNIV